MYGSTRTIHGTYQGFCRLEFYDSFLELHFPSFMSYHEKIDYCNIKHIFCNSDYSKIKIIYTQSNKTIVLYLYQNPMSLKTNLKQIFITSNLTISKFQLIAPKNMVYPESPNT